MYDILVNGQVVAVCVEDVVRLFVEALVRALGMEMTIQTRKHVEPATEETKGE